MRRGSGQTPKAVRDRRDPDEALELAGVGPDAHSAQEIGLAPEDIPKARRSVAEADRRAEARQERDERALDGGSATRRPGEGVAEAEASRQRERIGWSGAPERDERAESEHGLPPPEDVFHEFGGPAGGPDLSEDDAAAPEGAD